MAIFKFKISTLTVKFNGKGIERLNIWTETIKIIKRIVEI